MFAARIAVVLGVWLGAQVFDAPHSCDLIWLGSIALGLQVAALHWSIDDREIERVVIAGGEARQWPAAAGGARARPGNGCGHSRLKRTGAIAVGW